MKDFIKLEKTKYILANEKDIDILEDTILIDIIDIRYLKKIKNNNILFTLDFDNITSKNQFKQMMNNVIKVKKIYRKSKVNIGIEQDGKILLGLLKNYNKDDNHHREIIYSINAMFFDNIKERYEYIYDRICEYLDNAFIEKNLCSFENDKCIAKKDTNCTMGCCHNFKSIFSNDMVVCKYLKDKSCSIKCISCKLYTCDYLKKQGVQFKIKDILLADYFFNFMQKIVIKSNVFTPKEEIIRKIMFLRV